MERQGGHITLIEQGLRGRTVKKKAVRMMAMPLTVIPLRSRRMEGRFDVFGSLLEALGENREALEDGDVVVVSAKLVSNAQGRLVRAAGVRASGDGGRVSRRFRLAPSIAEIILRESDAIFGGVAGFVITSSGGIMAPNAGIDRSNAAEGTVILYPNDPYLAAEQLRRKAFLELRVHVGIVLADSRLMPARVGTSGVAIAFAGFEPVRDMRARRDLDGNPLKVTFQAVADNIAAIANQEMGEGSESRPFAIVRGSGARLTGRKAGPGETAVPPGQCVYVRGLSGASPFRAGGA